MLVEKNLFGVVDKEQIAIERIKSFEPITGFYVAFSGGKDSIVIADLVKKAGAKYELHYNITTVDPPLLIRFIKKHYPETIMERPAKNMWKLIIENGVPPYRQIRYCCRELKENIGSSSGRFVVTGLRWSESDRRRKTRKMVESCYKDPMKRFLNPIIDWTDAEVWEYIKTYKLPYPQLYDEGWLRIGCIGCPNSNAMKKVAFQRFPKIAELYKKAIIKCYENNVKKGKKQKFSSGEEWFEIWSTYK